MDLSNAPTNTNTNTNTKLAFLPVPIVVETRPCAKFQGNQVASLDQGPYLSPFE
jgi:hypothetical protein